MVQISRAAMCLAAMCFAAVSSVAFATTEGNATATAAGTESLGLSFNQCNIKFWYWEHDDSAKFDIKYLTTVGQDETTEVFHNDPMPIVTENLEYVGGSINLVQILPREKMVCISQIRLECGRIASGFGGIRTAFITADAIQESWIRKTNGDRKPVNWDHGPCMYFRSASWDKGSFRQLDIYQGVFGCGDDYMCMAGQLRTFGN